MREAQEHSVRLGVHVPAAPETLRSLVSRLPQARRSRRIRRRDRRGSRHGRREVRGRDCHHLRRAGGAMDQPRPSGAHRHIRRRRAGVAADSPERVVRPPLRQAGHVHLPLHAASLHEGRSRREMTDALDRLFERLVSVLADDAPGRLAVPFPAAEVYERLVPYRSNRSILRVATHQDYEMAVLRLLAGERGYTSLEPAEVQDALRREVGEANPHTTLFRQFPDPILSLNRLPAEPVLRGDRAYAPPPPHPPAPPPESLEAADGEEDRTEKPPLPAPASHLPDQTTTARPCPS